MFQKNVTFYQSTVYLCYSLSSLSLTLPLLFLQELFYEDKYYHAHCFRCFRCDRSLADEPFTSRGDALVCSDCFCNEFSSKCAACDKTVMPGSDNTDRIKPGCVLSYPQTPSSQASSGTDSSESSHPDFAGIKRLMSFCYPERDSLDVTE